MALPFLLLTAVLVVTAVAVRYIRELGQVRKLLVESEKKIKTLSSEITFLQGALNLEPEELAARTCFRESVAKILPEASLRTIGCASTVVQTQQDAERAATAINSRIKQEVTVRKPVAKPRYPGSVTDINRYDYDLDDESVVEEPRDASVVASR